MIAGRSARLAREDGFTLVELLVTMIVLGIMFSLFSLVISSTVSHTAVTANESVIEAQARTTLNQLAKDLREAALPTSSATSPFYAPSGVMSPTSLTFYAPDGTYSTAAPTTYHLREISYQLSQGNFQRASSVSTNTGPTWTIPALGSWVTEIGGVVSSTAFTYYDGSNPPVQTTNPAAVRTVVATLQLSIAGTSFEPTYSVSATLRITLPG